MNQTKQMKYTCPYCGKSFDIEIYTDIHADQDEDLRQLAVSGDLFRHSCPHCHREFMIQNPLIYIDQNHKFCLWLNENDAGKDLKTITAPLNKAGYILRRCPTLKEFCEKIEILEDGVDDRMVELCKYDCFIEFIDNKKGKAEDITSIEYQRTENEVMKINIRTGDKGMAFLTPLSMLEEEMKQNSSRYEIENENLPVVNQEWITSIFSKVAGEA